ncbi:hypothetical protein Q1695_002712 [Nippostrongylus brasiliensis]|nr:hypothetical protein Q1695_002712 [Nippostrongylus brasiliensis]
MLCDACDPAEGHTPYDSTKECTPNSTSEGCPQYATFARHMYTVRHRHETRTVRLHHKLHDVRHLCETHAETHAACPHCEIRVACHLQGTDPTMRIPEEVRKRIARTQEDANHERDKRRGTNPYKS